MKCICLFIPGTKGSAVPMDAIFNYVRITRQSFKVSFNLRGKYLCKSIDVFTFIVLNILGSSMLSRSIYITLSEHMTLKFWILYSAQSNPMD